MTARTTRLRRLAAGAALLAVLGAACGGNNDDTAQRGETEVTQAPAAPAVNAADAGTESGASALRAGLTSLLQEHVYLAGIAVNTGVGAGLDSPAFAASADTLDKNSVALSEAVGSVYGDAAGEQFLALWRKHIGFFVDYTKGQATGDQAAVDKARADLDGYRNDFGAFLASANPNLPKEAVAEELTPHVATLFAAIDAVVAKDPSVFSKLQAAAAHMPHTANVLAGAIVKQYPDKFSG